MSSKPKTFARRLLRKNRGTRTKPARSWRVIARDDFANNIPAGTLCRFAKADGEWIPKDDALQIALGLKHSRISKPHQPKMLSDMTEKTLLYALDHRTPMPRVDPRIIKAFKQLGWLKRVKAGAR